jgi:predicted flap endonuclease-1-like 5' DNA nuclease
MHYPSLFVGVLVGWVVEWLIDIFYWRRKYAGSAEVESELSEHLLSNEGDLETLRTQLAKSQELEKELNAGLVAANAGADSARVELADVQSGHQAVVDQLNADLSAAQDEISRLRGGLAGPDELTRAAPVAAGVAAVSLAAMTGAERAAEGDPCEEEDLTIIEGIGPKIAELLNQQDIRTFADLADTDAEHLRGILREGGTRFSIADPGSWPRQARLAANRDWIRLRALDEKLVGGVRRPPTAKEPEGDDDLTMIEGIGPKISATLQGAGIRTFAQLAETGVDRLQEIIDEAGPSFRLATPATWPEQARLAVARDWEDLHGLQDQLNAGREES